MNEMDTFSKEEKREDLIFDWDAIRFPWTDVTCRNRYHEGSTQV